MRLNNRIDMFGGSQCSLILLAIALFIAPVMANPADDTGSTVATEPAATQGRTPGDEFKQTDRISLEDWLNNALKKINYVINSGGINALILALTESLASLEP